MAIAGNKITTAKIAGDAVTNAKIADDAIDSEHYTDGSIDNAHIADDAIDSEHYADTSIDTAHIADNQVTPDKLSDIARGSLIIGNASAATAELTKGGANEVLTSDGTDIAWAAAGGGGNTSHNFLINGAMEVAQRGTSTTGGNQEYLLDRFYTYIFGAANRTISQVTDAPAGFKHSIKIARDNGDSGTAGTYFSQPCASDASVGAAGETVTLSFWAKAGANFSPTSSYISVALYSGTGTDQTLMAGLTGSVAVIGAVNQAITTSWVRYEFTSGSVVPTDSNQLVFQIIATPTGTAGADDWYEITGIQVEIGSSATDFVHEEYGVTLRKCQRYYQMHNCADSTYNVFGTGIRTGATTAEIPIPLPVTMREKPTFGYSGLRFRDYSGIDTTVTYSGTYADRTYCMLMLTAVSISNDAGYIQGNSSSDYMEWDAEL